MESFNLIPSITTDPLEEAIKALSDNPGALFEEKILKQLQKIRGQNPAEFARIRSQAKESRLVSMTEFDKLTEAKAVKNEDGTNDFFTEVEPWEHQVDGAELLDEIVCTLQRFVVAESSTLEATALWCIFTWFIDHVSVAPIANITAPEKRCGKTVLLTAMGKLVYRPFPTSNIATAALFRSIEKWAPTLLIDEVDAFLRENEEARGILNAGFEKEGAFVVRCVGDDHQPTRFNVWGAKALCGIGRLSGTLEDRSIVLPLRRKKPGEKTENLRRSDPQIWEDLTRKIARFYTDNTNNVASSRPDEIPDLNDRANDCWEPLMQVAEAAGGNWPKQARAAAYEISSTANERPSAGVELLTDIQSIFIIQNTGKIFTQNLVATLSMKEDAPWGTWNRGKPLSANQLAKRLSEYRVKPNTIRIGRETKKGYKLAQFTEAFDRYIAPSAPGTTVTPSHTNNRGDDINLTDEIIESNVTAQSLRNPNINEACDEVTDDDELSFF